MSGGLKRRGRDAYEPSYCEEEGPSPQLKRLRLDEAQDQHLWGLALPCHPAQQQQQQHAPGGAGSPDTAAVDAAAAEAEAAARAAALCGDAATYASINALLKRLHDERLLRMGLAPAAAGGGGGGALQQLAPERGGGGPA